MSVRQYKPFRCITWSLLPTLGPFFPLKSKLEYIKRRTTTSEKGDCMTINALQIPNIS